MKIACFYNRKLARYKIRDRKLSHYFACDCNNVKVSNLKKCLTTSQQTDNSHFRRDNDSQVYPAKQKGVQTKREKGTNPPTKTSYVAGLRGAVSDANPTKGRVVTLTLDL